MAVPSGGSKSKGITKKFYTDTRRLSNKKNARSTSRFCLHSDRNNSILNCKTINADSFSLTISRTIYTRVQRVTSIEENMEYFIDPSLIDFFISFLKSLISQLQLCQRFNSRCVLQHFLDSRWQQSITKYSNELQWRLGLWYLMSWARHPNIIVLN